MTDKLFFVKATQNEMYDLGNIMPITHFLLYNQTQKLAVDITSDVQQAPLLSAVPKMEVMSEKDVRNIEKIMVEGVKVPEEEDGCMLVTYVKQFECEELVGEQYAPIATAMAQLREAKTSLDSIAAFLQDNLISVGLIKPPAKEEESERIAVVDPSTLDIDTRKRLEVIIEGTQSDKLKARFYAELGNVEKAKQYREGKKYVDGTILAQVSDSRYFQRAKDLLDMLKRGEKTGMGEEERKKVMEKVHEAALIDKNYDIELEMSQELHLPEFAIAIIREKKLFSVMSSHYQLEDYISLVQEAAQSLPGERVKAIAEEAYYSLMGDKQFGGSNHIAAGQLAKKYLDRDKVLVAGKRLMEVHTEANYSRGYETVEMMAAEFELPEEMIHPLMLKFFAESLHRADNRAEQIRERHFLSDEEIKTPVNDSYNNSLGWGSFELALRLREQYSAFIEDPEVTIADLKTLIGVMYFRKEG
ncbi:MAG: hypothetical protein AABY26_06695 [Nanoarchaeota archaeon]